MKIKLTLGTVASVALIIFGILEYTPLGDEQVPAWYLFIMAFFLFNSLDNN